jgi:hypothetical protein
MDSFTTVIANYETPTYTLNVKSSGASDVPITGSLSTYSGTTNYSKTDISSGNYFHLTAPSTADDAEFDSWSGCSSSSGTECSITMTSDKTVTANYVTPEETYTLSVESSGASDVSITGSSSTYSGTTDYTKTDIDSGTSFYLTAPSTADGADFDSWSGCTASSGTQCDVTITSAKTVTANYITPGETYTLSVKSSGASDVSITGSSSTYSGTTDYTKTDIDSGTSFYLTAPSTSDGADFDSWSGCTSSLGMQCNVTMSSAKTVTANYLTSSPTYTLSVVSSGASGVSITGSSSTYSGTTVYTLTGLDSGTSFTLTAPATADSADFSRWSGCSSTSGYSCDVDMASDQIVTLYYEVPGLTGDFNSDDVVNYLDLGLLADHWLLTEDDAGWDSLYNLDATSDSDGSQIINYLDLSIFADNWLQTQ